MVAGPSSPSAWPRWLAGWSYTGGLKPIAYGPLGEVFVLIFSAWSLSAAAITCKRDDAGRLFAATLVGIHAAAVITVNNYRDHDGDKANGKNTLAVRLGRTATKGFIRWKYWLPYVPCCRCSPISAGQRPCPLAPCRWPGKLIHFFHNRNARPGFNQILAATAGLQLAFALLLSPPASRFDYF